MTTVTRIKQRAKELERSLSYICGKLGVARVYFIDIEKSGREIPDDKLIVIADILETTPEYLRGETDQKEKPVANDDDELREYLEVLKTRSDMRMLFSLAKGATKKDVEAAVKIIEALRSQDNGDE